MKQFSTRCEACNADVDFDLADVPELEVYLERECSEASDEARREEAAEYSGFIDPDPGLLKDLSIAIRKGDRVEAEILLDKLASEAGTRAEEAVQQGRYSLQARAA